jgi:phosphoglycolate phosphatase-like HAD superfamily hydrolase
VHTLVLFDIDGTLLSSDAAGRRAIRAAFEPEYDRLDFFDQVRFDGKTDPQIVRELHAAAGRPERATEAATEALLARYLDHLEQELTVSRERVRLMPGVLALLDRLDATPGVCVGLLTGNIEAGARLKLAAARVGFERFRLGAYGSDSADRPALPAIAVTRATPLFGHAPAGDRVVIIGDTPADVTCGAAVGARAIAVATGSYRVEELAAAGAYATFATLDATDAVCDAILCSNSN